MVHPRIGTLLPMNADFAIAAVTSLIPLGLAIVAIIIALAISRRVFPASADLRVAGQLTKVAIVIAGLILVLITVPIDNDLRGQLLSLVGLVLTGVIGLSSTTFVANAMAGLMLRTVESYTIGDFIRVEDHFGRVTEKALLHTEIQTEDRDLVTLPNLYIITHPVRVVRRSGTLISAEVSLGYDVHRHDVRDALLKAAESADLTDGFIQIIELGDYSITYRISGFLSDIDSMVGKRTQLRGRMLDELHAANIEIVSPSFMHQRPLQNGERFVPGHRAHEDDEVPSQPEAIMFDKATLATRVDKLKQQKERIIEEVRQMQEEQPDNTVELRWREQQITAISDILATLEEQKTQ